MSGKEQVRTKGWPRRISFPSAKHRTGLKEKNWSRGKRVMGENRFQTKGNAVRLLPFTQNRHRHTYFQEKNPERKCEGGTAGDSRIAHITKKIFAYEHMGNCDNQRYGFWNCFYPLPGSQITILVTRTAVRPGQQAIPRNSCLVRATCVSGSGGLASLRTTGLLAPHAWKSRDHISAQLQGACPRRKPLWKSSPLSKLSVSKLQIMKNDSQFACNKLMAQVAWHAVSGMRKNNLFQPHNHPHPCFKLYL